MTENNIIIHNIENSSDITNIKLVITNKNSSGTEKPTTENGYITLYKWKVDGQIVQSGSSESSRYYFPKSEDIDKIISCEVTAVSVYDENITLTKSSFIKIITDIVVETDFVPETDIVVETDFVPETDIVVETDFVPETDIVVETDFVPETDIVVETDIVNEPLVFPDFRIADPYVLTTTGATTINRINQEQLIGLELILVDRFSDQDSPITIDNLIQNYQSINYKWYYFDDVNELEIGNQSTYVIKESDIDKQISCKISVVDLDGSTTEKVNTQGGTIVNSVTISVLNYFVPETFVLRNELDENQTDLTTLEIIDPFNVDISIYVTSLGEIDNYSPELENGQIKNISWKINNNVVFETQNDNYFYLDQTTFDENYDPQIQNILSVEVEIIPDIPVCNTQNNYSTDISFMCPIEFRTVNIPINIPTYDPAFIPDFRITETDILDQSNYTELTRINSNQLIGVELILLEKNSTYNSLTDVQYINELIENAESISYTWYYNDTNETVIGTESSYTIKAEDINQRISCKITVTGLDGSVIEKISNQTINLSNNTIITWVKPTVIEYIIDSVVIEDDNGPVTQTIEITNPLESDFSLYGVADYTNVNGEHFVWTINDVEVIEYDNFDILDINQDIINNYFVPGNNEIKFKVTITQPDMVLCYGSYGYENDPEICPSLESESSIITISMT